MYLRYKALIQIHWKGVNTLEGSNTSKASICWSRVMIVWGAQISLRHSLLVEHGKTPTSPTIDGRCGERYWCWSGTHLPDIPSPWEKLLVLE